MCCSVLQCVAVCCSVLQCVASCSGIHKCVAVCCSVLQCIAVCCIIQWDTQVCCSVQYIAVYCSVLHHAAGYISLCHNLSFALSHIYKNTLTLTLPSFFFLLSLSPFPSLCTHTRISGSRCVGCENEHTRAVTRSTLNEAFSHPTSTRASQAAGV